MAGSDPLAKNAADKLVIARQKFLQAHARREQAAAACAIDMLPKERKVMEKEYALAYDREHEAHRQWQKALENFDKTYGGDL